MAGGDASLQIEDPAGLVSRIGDPGQRQHGFDVRQVGLPDLGMLVETVILLVRQADPGLADEQQVARRITRIGVVVQIEKTADAVSQRPSPETCQIGGRGDLVHLVEQRAQRRDAQFLNGLGVHEGGVEVRDTRGVRALALGVPSLDDLADGRLRGLSQLVERTPPAAILRDLGPSQPGAVHMPEEVVGRTDVVVEEVAVQSFASH